MNNSLLKDILKTLDQKRSSTFDLASLAKEIGYSKYHLCRAFHAATGEPLITYMRRLALARSAEQLREGGRIIDTAFEYGYQSQEAYHRAFVSMFNITPKAFQSGRHHPSLLLKKPWNETMMPVQEPENYACELDAFSLWGLGGEYSYEELDEIAILWERFHKLIPQQEQSFGVTYELPENPDRFRYFAACSESSKEHGLKSLRVPQQRYQVFKHQGSIDTLMQTFNYIWGLWLPSHGAKVSGVDFERYPPGYQPHDNSGYIDIFIPLAN